MIDCVVISNSAILLLFHLLVYSKHPPKYLAMFRSGNPFDSTLFTASECVTTDNVIIAC